MHTTTGVYTRVRDLVVIHCSAGQSFLSIFFLFFHDFFSRMLRCMSGGKLCGNTKYDSTLAIQSGKWDQLGSLALLL